jgi:hypothetical protein
LNDPVSKLFIDRQEKARKEEIYKKKKLFNDDLSEKVKRIKSYNRSASSDINVSMVGDKTLNCSGFNIVKMNLRQQLQDMQESD